jgi:hypothetical protein
MAVDGEPQVVLVALEAVRVIEQQTLAELEILQAQAQRKEPMVEIAAVRVQQMLVAVEVVQA